MTLRNSSFTSNQAAYSGGAVRSVDSNFTTRDCTFSLNSSTGSGGGAIDLENGSFHDANGSYSNNSAGLGGGAMRWTNTTGSVQDSNFTENQNPTSNGGGAISLSNASLAFQIAGSFGTALWPTTMVARSRCSDPHQVSLTAYSREITAKSTRAAQSMQMVPLRPHSRTMNSALIIRFNSGRDLCREQLEYDRRTFSR